MLIFRTVRKENPQANFVFPCAAHCRRLHNHHFPVTLSRCHEITRSCTPFSAMENASTTLEPLFAFLAHSLATLEDVFNKIPGSAVILRYVKSSHQNDPGRTLLELILAVFAIRTLLQSRTRADRTEKHFIKFSEQVCNDKASFYSNVRRLMSITGS
jgi:hypothetical protein